MAKKAASPQTTTQDLRADMKALSQAASDLGRSATRVSQRVSQRVLSLPFTLAPAESRRHLRRAGRELLLATATAHKDAATCLERLADRVGGEESAEDV